MTRDLRKGEKAQAATNPVVTALSTAFSTVASDAMDAISAILPIALPVMGAIVVVTIGIKIFRKVTGR